MLPVERSGPEGVGWSTTTTTCAWLHKALKRRRRYLSAKAARGLATKPMYFAASVQGRRAGDKSAILWILSTNKYTCLRNLSDQATLGTLFIIAGAWGRQYAVVFRPARCCRRNTKSDDEKHFQGPSGDKFARQERYLVAFLHCNRKIYRNPVFALPFWACGTSIGASALGTITSVFVDMSV